MASASLRDSKQANTTYEFSATRLSLAIRRVQLALKFDQNQPRAPAGQSNGGQWVGGSRVPTGDTDLDAESKRGDVARIVSIARRLRPTGKPAGFEQCLDLCYPLLERRQATGSDRDYWDFQRCLIDCLKTSD